MLAVSIFTEFVAGLARNSNAQDMGWRMAGTVTCYISTWAGGVCAYPLMARKLVPWKWILGIFVLAAAWLSAYGLYLNLAGLAKERDISFVTGLIASGAAFYVCQERAKASQDRG